MRPYLFSAVFLSLLGGCATGPTHDSRLVNTITATNQGDISAAIDQLETHTTGALSSDLLLNLEKGETLRIGSRYKESLSAFEIADRKVNQWEATARSSPAQLMGHVSAIFAGDNSREYEGQDYEKLMLTTRMAMDRVSLGDLDTARVNIKRTHEREAVIAAFRERETAAAEQEARDKGVRPGAKELNGYPIETLNDPEVLKLKNGFQNALSLYLSGYVYEALNEPGLAAPGYRKAIELRPDLPVLEEGLRGLDSRTGFSRNKGVTDVLFIIESGNAPARKSQKVSFPVPTNKGLITVSLAFPVIFPDREALSITQLNLGSIMVPVALVTDFNVMARKALKDELPGMQLRSAARAVGKGLLQDQANKQLGAFGGLIGNLVATAAEPEADDRLWRTLPGWVFIARASVPPGEYDMRIPGQPDASKKLAVSGRYMVVPVRMFRNKTYFGESVRFGESGAIASTASSTTSATGSTAPSSPLRKVALQPTSSPAGQK